MAMLDKRLKRMEERVIKIVPKEEQGVVSSTGRAVVKPPLPPAPPRSAGGSKKRAAEAAFGDELDEWANAKAPVADSKDGVLDETDKEPLKKQVLEEHNLLQEGADKLPSKEIQEHLAEVFFRRSILSELPATAQAELYAEVGARHGTAGPDTRSLRHFSALFKSPRSAHGACVSARRGVGKRGARHRTTSVRHSKYHDSDRISHPGSA